MAKKKEAVTETVVPEEAQDGLQSFTNSEGKVVVYLTGIDGSTHYAWRKDGQRPEVIAAEFANNKNAAITPLGTADFASVVKPE